MRLEYPIMTICEDDIRHFIENHHCFRPQHILNDSIQSSSCVTPFQVSTYHDKTTTPRNTDSSTRKEAMRTEKEINIYLKAVDIPVGAELVQSRKKPY